MLASRVLLPLLLGCLDPFPHDRHDLIDLRIVAMGLGGDDPSPLDAYVWEGTQAWSAAAPERAWVIEDDCGLDYANFPACGTFELTITGPDGATEAGVLEVDAAAQRPELLGFARTLGEAGGTVSIDVPDATAVRWMAPAGEVVGVEQSVATFTAPVDDAGLPKAGVWPVVALWMDGRGGNAWATFDVPVGVEGPFLQVGGRLLPVITELPSGAATVFATVTATEDFTGFALTDLVVDDGLAMPDAACNKRDAQALATETWDPDSVIERICGRDEVAGARVRVVGEIVR